jgi:phenylalanyl-tRNA synthetase beta chain
MKISYNWLKDYLPNCPSIDIVSNTLTSLGLEVDGITQVGVSKEKLEGLVVGYVQELFKHPNADKLRIAKVDVNASEMLQIVCGASNIEQGQKVVVATVGTKLYPTEGDSFTIKKSKLRGELSEGMICAEDEIGLSNNHDGIMVLNPDTQIGIPVSEVANTEEDYIIEIGLTPNRVDAANHLGVARELAAALSLELNFPDVSMAYPSTESTIKIELNHEDCYEYIGVEIKNVTIRQSPDWLVSKLRSLGIGSINNVVDITNFVMMELGHPLHAFDSEKIANNTIIVRKANKNEKLNLLNKIEIELNEEDLCICDSEKPLALAGIMGGSYSGISNNTQSVFIESAMFNPKSIRKSSKVHGLSTDASYRYERGANQEILQTVLNRCVDLICSIADGVLASKPIIKSLKPLEKREVVISVDYINNLIGANFDKELVSQLLIKSGFEVFEYNSEQFEFKIEIPSYKIDVSRKADIVEELLRFYGLDNVKSATHISISPKNYNYSLYKKKTQYRNLLVSDGFHEVVMLAMVSDKEIINHQKSIQFINPLSAEQNFLRDTHLWQGVNTIAYNLNRQETEVRIFTESVIFRNQTEQKVLTLFLSGNNELRSYATKQKSDYFNLKKTVEAIISLYNPSQISYQNINSDEYEYATELFIDNVAIGLIGLLNTDRAEELGVDKPVYAAELFIESLESLNQRVKYQRISKFPKVVRDLSLLVPKDIKYQEIQKLIFGINNKLIKEVFIFDIYEGDNLPKNTKSYAIRMEMVDVEKTLLDKEIDELMETIIKSLKDNLNIELRS